MQQPHVHAGTVSDNGVCLQVGGSVEPLGGQPLGSKEGAAPQGEGFSHQLHTLDSQSGSQLPDTTYQGYLRWMARQQGQLLQQQHQQQQSHRQQQQQGQQQQRQRLGSFSSSSGLVWQGEPLLPTFLLNNNNILYNSSSGGVWQGEPPLPTPYSKSAVWLHFWCADTGVGRGQRVFTWYSRQLW